MHANLNLVAHWVTSRSFSEGERRRYYEVRFSRPHVLDVEIEFSFKKGYTLRISPAKYYSRSFVACVIGMQA